MLKRIIVVAVVCLMAAVFGSQFVPVTVGWDQVPEATSYDVYIGYSPRTYFRHVSTTNTTCALLLTPGVTNYLAVTTVVAPGATNQSQYSLELIYSAGKWFTPPGAIRQF